MSETGLVTRSQQDAVMIEQVVVGGDLSKMTAAERVRYYQAVCKSLDLNPLTKPFDYLHLNGKLVLYATRTATDQLASNRGLSLETVKTERIDDVYVVTARATEVNGRSVSNVGAVTIGSLKGDALANAIMKAVTKAYRRTTLAFCGLGWIDESEVETIPSARRVVVAETGEIIESQSAPTPKPTPLRGERPRADNVRDYGEESKSLVNPAEAQERARLLSQIAVDAQAAMISTDSINKAAKREAKVDRYQEASTDYLIGLAERIAAKRNKPEPAPVAEMPEPPEEGILQLKDEEATVTDPRD